MKQYSILITQQNNESDFLSLIIMSDFEIMHIVKSIKSENIRYVVVRVCFVVCYAEGTIVYFLLEQDFPL